MKHTAPSKINLFLKVLDKRPDSYHNIESIFLPLSNPVDIISITHSETNTLEIKSSTSGIPLDSSNLCWKAAEKFAEFTGETPSWTIDIEKNIPVAAGMGGGSSDAAAVLKILNENFKIPEEKLFSIALELGADIPFFLNPRPSVAKGVGEILEPLNIDFEIPLLIVNPGFPISTPWAYQNGLSAEKPSFFKEMVRAIEEKDLKLISKYLQNDLSPAAFYKFPLLSMLKNSMKNAGAMGVEMTGSGPTLFAICESPEKAESVSLQIKDEYGDTVKTFVNLTPKS
jgi:4-diphosphocytidyl-2-C-methyl-D-erythritol kinase